MATNGNDTFTLTPSSDFEVIDGLDGSDTIIADYSSGSLPDLAQYDGSSGIIHGNGIFLNGLRNHGQTLLPGGIYIRTGARTI